MSRTTIAEMHQEWMKDPEYKSIYDSMEEEFALVSALIGARAHANLTQEELAQRMATTQSAIARMEGGRNPSFNTLKKFAKATGTRLKISFEPI